MGRCMQEGTIDVSRFVDRFGKGVWNLVVLTYLDELR